VVHEDEACAVVLKPAGLLSVPGRGALAAGSLAEQVQQRWPEARVVHRLDMATSGLLLFARGLHWQRVFSRLFAERAIEKHYVAIVRGDPAAEAGEIALPLAADWPNRPRQHVDLSKGKPARTRWQVLARDPAGTRTRLALQPLTGRTHQLRVHLAEIGHPILGDALYSPDSAAAEAPRLMLHAQGLAFVHPLHGVRLQLHAPAPF
jgi:tRNA pseudouridine32 synthase/23S rRNA pseudouridine746 synthase